MLKNKKEYDIIFPKLRWDYMNNNVLISTAMLSAFWEEEKKDIFDLLSPFVEYSIAKTTHVGNMVDVSKLLEYLKTEFGYEEIPINTINLILNRFSPRSLMRENNKYYLKISLDQEVSKFEKGHVLFEERRERVAIALVDYLNTHLLVRFNQETALNALLEFFAANGMCVISDIMLLELIGGKNDELMYCIAQFIIDEHEKDSAIFYYILDMVKGFFVSTAISLQPQNTVVTESKFKGLKCYIDTRIIINALEMASKTEAIAANELLTMLREKGAELYCFEHTYLELDSIIDAYKNKLRYPRSPHSRTFRTLEGWDAKNYTVTDVERYQSTLKNKIESLGITITQAPDFTENTKRYPFSDNELNDYINSNMSYGNKDALDNDIKSIASILLLRDGYSSNSIEECKFVFVTPNIKLANHSNTYLLKSNIIGNNSVMPTITDVELSSIVWLKCYASHKDYPKNKLIEYAFIALEPTEIIIKTFQEMVDKIQADGELTEDEATIIKVDHFSRRNLSKLVRGDVSRVNKDTVYKIKAELEKRLVGCAGEKAEQSQLEAAVNLEKYNEEKKKREEEENKTKNIRGNIIHDIKDCGKKTQGRVRKICRGIFHIFVIAFFVAAFILSVMSIEKGSCMWIAIPSAILGILGVIDMTISKFNYIYRLIDKLAYRRSIKVIDKKKKEYERRFKINLTELV